MRKLSMRKYAPVFFAAVLCYTGCGVERSKIDPEREFDIFIHGGDVIDGTGRRARRADVLIDEERIVFIGDIGRKNIAAAVTIDATGKVVTPGFIDSHAHGDPIAAPEFRNFLAMGVTTIILGQDGASARAIKTWMNKVDSVRPALNVATLVGHGTVRHAAGVRLNPRSWPVTVFNRHLLPSKGSRVGDGKREHSWFSDYHSPLLSPP